VAPDAGRIDWTRPAEELARLVRAFTPWPGAFTYLPAQPKPLLLKIWGAELVSTGGHAGEILSADKSGIVIGCGEDALRITILQREGGRRMSAQEFLAGHPLSLGITFQFAANHHHKG
jgi:methionyl-tRNA formyltransferase